MRKEFLRNLLISFLLSFNYYIFAVVAPEREYFVKNDSQENIYVLIKANNETSALNCDSQLLEIKPGETKLYLKQYSYNDIECLIGKVNDIALFFRESLDDICSTGPLPMPVMEGLIVYDGTRARYLNTELMEAFTLDVTFRQLRNEMTIIL